MYFICNMGRTYLAYLKTEFGARSLVHGVGCPEFPRPPGRFGCPTRTPPGQAGRQAPPARRAGLATQSTQRRALLHCRLMKNILFHVWLRGKRRRAGGAGEWATAPPSGRRRRSGRRDRIFASGKYPWAHCPPPLPWRRRSGGRD